MNKKQIMYNLRKHFYVKYICKDMDTFINPTNENPITAIADNTNPELIINNCRVKDISLLASQHWLRYLTLENLSIRDLSAIAGLPLESLWLENLPIFSVPLIPSMKMLTLHGLPWSCDITALRAMSNLREMDISFTILEDTATLGAVSTQLTRLRIDETGDTYSFMINNNLERLFASGVSYVPPLPNLRYLEVVNDNSILSRIHEYPSLEVVDGLVVTRETTEMFYNLLENNTSLRYITAVIFPYPSGYKKFYNTVLDKALKILQHNTTIKDFRLFDEYTAYKNKKRVKNLFKRNTTLERLTITTNFRYEHPAANFMLLRN